MPSDPQQSRPKFYLTTPIYYVNARPHIGHAYTTIVADVLARRHRLQGDDTFFLTGTDEHGQKIERSAAAAGVPPQQFADEISAQFRNLWDRMGLTYNDYIRTTDPAHKKGAQQLFRTLYERGFIYLSTYTGSYCVSDEAFVDLPAGTQCPDCGRLLETVTEENFFFKLSEFQRPLLDLIESNQLLITPDTARNEVLSFLRGNTLPEPSDRPHLSEQLPNEVLRTSEGHMQKHIAAAEEEGVLKRTSAGNPFVPGALKDLSISRSSFTWGIPVPSDVQQAAGTTQPHIIYVWLDALANYITAIGYGTDDPKRQADFERYWPADLHLVGKEITRFHCVYWPAFLMAAGLETPKQITANGWLLFDNSKMSKSKGNVVRTETILDAFGDHVYGKQFPDSTKQERDLFAADVLRYFLLREIPFGQDGSFSFDALVTRYNADLANGYGNLVSRTLKMVSDYFNSTVAPNDPFGTRDWYAEEADRLWYEGLAPSGPSGSEASDRSGLQLLRLSQQVAFLFNSPDAELGRGLLSLAALIQTVDVFITANAPWKRIKSKDISAFQDVEKVLYTAAEAIRIITLLLHPILPYATAKVWQQLGLGDIELATSHQPLATLLQWGGIQPGTKLGPLSPIFPRADKSLVQVMIDMEEARNTPSHLTPSSLAPEQNTPASTLKDTTTPTPATPVTPNPTDPAAPPRTSALDEPSGTLPVAGSSAEKPALPTTPGPYTEAPASGVFAAQQTTNNQQPTTNVITIDDFMKVELRVAQVVTAERIPKADKLLRLEVDLGPELGRRQILSGIAQHYTPEELLGHRIVVVANLAPRKMRGLDSHGMLLAASEGPDGKPILATFGDDIALGSRVR